MVYTCLKYLLNQPTVQVEEKGREDVYQNNNHCYEAQHICPIYLLAATIMVLTLTVVASSSGCCCHANCTSPRESFVHEASCTGHIS